MRQWMSWIAGIVVLGAAVAQAAEPPAIPPAFGPHVNLKPADFEGVPSFKAGQKIVGTYYFYWYDIHTKGHIVDGDGTDALTTHPPTLEDFSYKSVKWHRKQLEDMMAAGIDVLLPVFWGAPSEQKAGTNLHWSYEGLPPLVKARQELLDEGKRPPRIGLFYDTSTLQYNRWGIRVDCTTDYGRQWFYATVRDFYSMIPPKHWAMIDGQPIVLLYSAAFAKKHDQSVIDYTKAQFPREFGGRVPWIAREVSWQVKADSTVAWGGALGLRNVGIASLGPGYDHSAVPGRTPLVVERRDGKFYEESWQRLLRRPADFVMLETWNEFHEGTDIAESKESGRQYIELTRKYVDLFKSGKQVAWPKGEFTGAAGVWAQLGKKNQERGLRAVENEDGVTEPAEAAGREGRRLTASAQHNSYMYFVVDDSFKEGRTMQLVAVVEYLDAAAGSIGLEFDGSDSQAPFAGAYTASRTRARLAGDGKWKTVAFELPDALIMNSQNKGADLRLVIQAPGAVVARVEVKRKPGKP